MKNFLFLNKLTDISRNIFIKKTILNEEELFTQFSSQLEFPDYFGKNWNALWDCLCDLTWIDQQKINIIHQDIPLKTDFKEQKRYINLIFDLVDEYRIHKHHSLEVYFPIEFKEEIEKLKHEIDEGKPRV